MSNSSDYTITTVSSSVFQHSTSNGQPAPFSILPFRAQYRDSGFPYVTGPKTALDWSLGVPVSQSAASGGGGGGIPGSIIARSNLIHWWKMNDDPSAGATNYGLSASSELSMSFANGATQTAGGPSAIGSPTYIKFNGTNQFGTVPVVDTSNNDTSINTVFREQNTSITFWIQTFQTDAVQFDPLFVASSHNAWNNGVGSWNGNPGLSAGYNSFVGHYSNGGAGLFGTGTQVVSPNRNDLFGGWAHVGIVLDNAGDALKVYLNGALSGSLALNQDDITMRVAGNTGNHGSYLVIASGPSNAQNAAFATNLYLNMGMNDFRIYNTALTTTQMAGIAAGDWT
jgi:hypothetical protein|tara:strand:+ start:3190 stop:4209 length:1020 start_codon:yes stop_codon:yes gene_type:complete